MTREELDALYVASKRIDAIGEMLERADKGQEFKIMVGQLTIGYEFVQKEPFWETIYEGLVKERRMLEGRIDSASSSVWKENSCDNCKFVIRGGEDENDECDGSHPVELAAGDFCCNRWEKCDEV